MKILTISNLYPRPDRPQAGMFNAQLFREMAATDVLQQITLVPEWRVWRWAGIRKWVSPYTGGHGVEYWPVLYVPGVGRNWSAGTYARSLKGLASRVAAADVVFASWLYPDGVVAATLAQAAGKPAWLMVLGSDVQHLQAPARRKQILEACRVAAGIVCVGRHLATALIEAGVDSHRVHVVPNGVDAVQFCFRPREVARTQLAAHGFPAGVTRMVLFVGNLVSVKAPERFLCAMADLADPTVHAGLIGTGPMQAGLVRLARRRGVGDRVHILGRQDHAHVALWMNAADVLCLCSRREGMPNVILEALASGLPVAATDVGACRDMLGDEAAARLAAEGDAAALARALRELLTMPVDRAKMAARHGRRSWSDQARDILQLMR